MEIPTNHHNDNEEVNKLTKELLERLQRNNFTYAGLDCLSKYGQDTLRKVLDNFKNKGYYTYYHQRFDGVWIGIQVYNYDYQPRNGGLNKLLKY